jgi:hypothetical protein
MMSDVSHSRADAKDARIHSAVVRSHLLAAKLDAGEACWL